MPKKNKEAMEEVKRDQIIKNVIPVRSPVIDKLGENRNIQTLPKVGFDVFCRVSGIKKDQCAGFRYFITSKNITRLTIPEWQIEYSLYRNKVVK